MNKIEYCNECGKDTLSVQNWIGKDHCEDCGSYKK